MSMQITIALALLSAPAAAESVRVIDGDTFASGGVHYRLPDVDAAETRRPECAAERAAGEAAKAALGALAADRDVRIRTTGETCGYDRPCADLIVDGESAIAIGLRAGWLRPWPHKRGRATTPEPDWCDR